FGPAMVLLGRYTCTHAAPRCDECVMSDLCPKVDLNGDEASEEPEEGERDEEAEEPQPDESETAVKNRPSKKTAASKKPARRTVPGRTRGKPAAEEAVPSLKDLLPADWQQVLAEEFEKPYFKNLEKFVADERRTQQVFPPVDEMFNAFKHTPYDRVKVL